MARATLTPTAAPASCSVTKLIVEKRFLSQEGIMYWIMMPCRILLKQVLRTVTICSWKDQKHQD